MLSDGEKRISSCKIQGKIWTVAYICSSWLADSSSLNEVVKPACVDVLKLASLQSLKVYREQGHPQQKVKAPGFVLNMDT